jgi:hypothetical protein
MEILFALLIIVLLAWLFKSGKVTIGTKNPSPPVRRSSKSKSAAKAEGLTFKIQGTDPEVDENGRVIVRLAAGAQIDLGLKIMGGEGSDRYLLGKQKDDFVERSVRGRVYRVTKRDMSLFQVESPKGEFLGEIIYKDLERANKVFDTFTEALPKIDNSLHEREFVFDVSIKVEGEWSPDDEEVDGWFGDVHDASIRIRDPASLDIR